MKKILSLFLAALMVFMGISSISALTPYYVGTPSEPSAAYKASIYYEQLCAVQLTGNQVEDLIAVAESQLGYHEGNSTSDLGGTNTSGSNNYTEYGYWYDGNAQHQWCAGFVVWCARQANISKDIIRGSLVASYESNYLNVAFTSRANANPQRGDLIFFDWADDGRDGNSDHVGIVLENDGTNVTFIDGNSSENCVRTKSYALTNANILGYGRPNYVNSEVNPPQSDEGNKTQYRYSRYVNEAGANGKHWNNGARCYPTKLSGYYGPYYTDWMDEPYPIYKDYGSYVSYGPNGKYDEFGLDWYNEETRTVSTSITLTLDPNDGIGESWTTTVPIGAKYYDHIADLSEYQGRFFVGWYTEKTGGTLITEETVITSNTDHTIYGRWTEPVDYLYFDASEYTAIVGEEVTIKLTVLLDYVSGEPVITCYFPYEIANVSTNRAVKEYTIIVKPSQSGWYNFNVLFDDKSETCYLNVGSNPVTGVSLNKTTASMTEGESLTLTATVVPENATNKNVTWSSSDTNVATVSASGVVTAKSVGTATITVKTADGSKTATCVVTVKAKTIAVTGVSLNKTSATMTEGETLTLTATVAPTNATNKNVTWTSSNTSIATVSASGVVTAKSAGTATITVTTADGSKKATCVVTVSALEEPLNPDAAVIVVNDVTTRAGETFDVTVDVANNPGMCFLQVTLEYDKSVLTLKGASNGSVLSAFENGVNLQWSADADSSKNGTLVTLTFEVNENAGSGDYTVNTIFREAYDSDINDVVFTVSAGTITVADFIYGDANGDGEVNGKDAVLLRKYMVNYNYDTGTSSVVVSSGADANGDGTVNGKDAVLLRKYMVNYNYDTGTSSVVLGPQQ
ncbi:MAG: Ig-like domain-containing protein [Clostridia bacterium]|nr:Ig-like domain-containing protein [Clostridia bacterium]